jgi:ATP-dependent DNA helicase RecG
VLLLGERVGGETLARIEAFAATTDGFRIAEQDFRLRGPGEFTGLRQWGRPEFRVAVLWLHREELEAARAVAASASASGDLDRLSVALALPGAEERRVPVG